MVAHIIYFANDWVWAALLSGLIPRTRLLVTLVNFVNAFFLAGITYNWFLYAAAAEQLTVSPLAGLCTPAAGVGAPMSPGLFAMTSCPASDACP